MLFKSASDSNIFRVRAICLTHRCAHTMAITIYEATVYPNMEHMFLARNNSTDQMAYAGFKYNTSFTGTFHFNINRSDFQKNLPRGCRKGKFVRLMKLTELPAMLTSCKAL